MREPFSRLFSTAHAQYTLFTTKRPQNLARCPGTDKSVRYAVHTNEKMATSSRSKKRKRSASFSQPPSEPEEAVDEQSATLTRTDLMWYAVYGHRAIHSFNNDVSSRV